MVSTRWAPALRRSVASRRLASSSSTWTPRRRRSGSPGRCSIVRVMTWALGVESHPSARASPTGANSGVWMAVASRTMAGPVALWPPVTAVRKSWVEAHPTGLTAWVASISVDHVELEGVQGGAEGLDLGDGVHQLLAASGRPQGLGQLTDLSADPCQGTRDTTGTGGAGWGVRVGGHEAIQASTTDSPGGSDAVVHKENLGIFRCFWLARPGRVRGSARGVSTGSTGGGSGRFASLTLLGVRGFDKLNRRGLDAAPAYLCPAYEGCEGLSPQRARPAGPVRGRRWPGAGPGRRRARVSRGARGGRGRG